jgi:tRNA(fMet)-specific endonuclease VapC
MPARYLLGTNTASYAIKGHVPQVREHLLKIPTTDVAISVITEAELRFRAVRVSNPKRIAVAVEEFLKYVDIYPWTSAAAREYAKLRAVIEHEGRPMGNLDLMIAAHALALGTVLVTSDRVFRRVKGLTIEDWAVPNKL